MAIGYGSLLWCNVGITSAGAKAFHLHNNNNNNNNTKVYQLYKVKQYNTIMDVLGGWSRDLEDELNELVAGKSKGVLHNMQKAVISGTLNISRTFKVAR